MFSNVSIYTKKMHDSIPKYILVLKYYFCSFKEFPIKRIEPIIDISVYLTWVTLHLKTVSRSLMFIAVKNSIAHLHNVSFFSRMVHMTTAFSIKDFANKSNNSYCTVISDIPFE